ncbi:unnamed protein product [Rotaria sp. Silwood1]|nr:unnamed protein product [Rotaria sp. Silwood1]
MPGDYMNFSKHTPRTCEIRLSTTDQTFGFDIVYGKYDIGAYIQEIAPDSPASPTILRKNDRALEINDKFIDNEPNAELAGVKSEDRLIEINGVNVQNMDFTFIKQCLRNIKYPQSLQLLVANVETFNYYKQQNKAIHSKLPSVTKLSENKTSQSSPSVASVQKVNINDIYPEMRRYTTSRM